jgi:hypothetical protein
MNPARSFGTVLFTNRAAWNHFWIYMVAPFVGTIIAVILTYLFVPRASKSVERRAKGVGLVEESLPIASEW